MGALQVRTGLGLRSPVLSWRVTLPLLDGSLEINVYTLGVFVLFVLEVASGADLRLVDRRCQVLLADIRREFLLGNVLNSDLRQVLHDQIGSLFFRRRLFRDRRQVDSCLFREVLIGWLLLLARFLDLRLEQKLLHLSHAGWILCVDIDGLDFHRRLSLLPGFRYG